MGEDSEVSSMLQALVTVGLSDLLKFTYIPTGKCTVLCLRVCPVCACDLYACDLDACAQCVLVTCVHVTCVLVTCVFL